MSVRRIAVTVLESGQLRPYADHRLRVQIEFEHLERATCEEWWSHYDFGEEGDVVAVLKTLKCGFTDRPPVEHFDARLIYLKRIDVGVWEFLVTQPYTG